MKIKRFKCFSSLFAKLFGKTKLIHVGNWIALKDSEIPAGTERVDDDVLYKYNVKWKTDGRPVNIKVVKGFYYIKDNTSNKIDYSLGPTDRLPYLIKDIKKGLIYTDNPDYDTNYADKTHFLIRLSKLDEYLVYSESVSSGNRLTYKVFKPTLLPNGELEIVVELNNFRDHRFNGKLYSWLRG